MPRQAATASAGASEATNEDELLHWRSLRHSVAASGRQSSSEGPHSLAHADFDCADTILARAGTGISASVTAEESARDGRGDAEARSPGSALRKSICCCSRARALSCTPTERASQCRRPLPCRRTSTCTAFIHYLVGILFLSLLAAPPARAGAVAYVKAFPRTRMRRWFYMLAIFQSTLAAPGERNSPERRGRPAGLWSSLAFEPRILHAPTSLKVAFRMTIPLASDEMVIFSLPGFRRDGGSGFLSGGPAIDDHYRFVTVHPPKGIDRIACLQCARHSCSVLLMFDSRFVRNVVGVMSHRLPVLQGVLEFVRRKIILYCQGHSSAGGNSLPGTGPFSWHLHSEGRSHRKQQPAGHFNQRRGRRLARHSLSVCGDS